MAFGEDPERVEAVIVDAVRTIEGVAADKPIDVLLMKVSKSGLTFRLRWWMTSYQEGRYAPDKVLRSVYAAMLESGIELSLDAYEINITSEEEVKQQVPQDAHSETKDG
jgi:small-conductance mechanosensitive channel